MSRPIIAQELLDWWTKVIAASKRQRWLECVVGQVRCIGSHGPGSLASAGLPCPHCGACK